MNAHCCPTCGVAFTRPLELRTGKLLIDSARGLVWFDGYPLQLTPSSQVVLRVLARRPGVWFTRDQILDAIGDLGDMDERSVDARIKRIRQKLRPFGGDGCVETLHRFGYRWNPQ